MTSRFNRQTAPQGKKKGLNIHVKVKVKCSYINILTESLEIIAGDICNTVTFSQEIVCVCVEPLLVKPYREAAQVVMPYNWDRG